nr:hypothetical protein B0A51_01184 [Rachicladosporium sp. CCFEE 5018]
MHRTKVFNWGEGNTLTYLVEAVLKMMSDTGGEAAWRAKSEAEIKAMLLAQFDECPMIITQLTFRHANNSIALEKIWRSTDANMIEYQTLIRKKWILLAHGAWSECLRQGGGLKADREELQKHYHKHMRDPSLLPDISMLSDVNLCASCLAPTISKTSSPSTRTKCFSLRGWSSWRLIKSSLTDTSAISWLHMLAHEAPTGLHMLVYTITCDEGHRLH